MSGKSHAQSIPDAATTQEPTEDIRDIRGPKAVAGASQLPLIIFGVVLLAGLAFIVWLARRRTQKARKLTLTEQTLRRLEAIRHLMQPVTAREFGIAASEIVRTYIELRFQVVATQRTTEEFLQGLIEASHVALKNHRALLSDFLEKCDLVKFAGASLAASDMESLYESARIFVLETGQPAGA
jgi:Domain of unknown function (DUF4381)